MMNPPGSEGSNGKSTQLGASPPVIRGLFLFTRFFNIAILKLLDNINYIILLYKAYFVNGNDNILI